MSTAQENSILSDLTQQELAFLSPHMKLLEVKQGDVIFEPGQKPEYYYFPVKCSLELSIDMADGRCGSTAVIDSIFPIDLSVGGAWITAARYTVLASVIEYRHGSFMRHCGKVTASFGAC